MTAEERLKEEIENIILIRLKKKISKKKLAALVDDYYRTFTGLSSNNPRERHKELPYL